MHRGLLIGHVSADRLQEIGDEVVTAVEFDVDLAPGLLDEVAQTHEAVVGDDHPEDDDEEKQGSTGTKR